MVGEFTGAGEFEQFGGVHETVTEQPVTDGATEGSAGSAEGTPEEWKQAYDNRQSWERAFKQRDQKFAAARRLLETAFNRPFGEWNQVDLSDLQAFAMINQQVRSNPEFARKWQTALTQVFQESGASKAEAKAAAAEVIDAARQQPAAQQQPQIPKEIMDRLTRMEQIAVAQQMDRLEGTLWDQLDTQVAAVAPDLAEDYGQIIEEAALQGLFFHSDVELMQRAQNGTLPQLVGYYVKQASDRLRAMNQAALQRQAQSKTKAKEVGPAPFGASATAPAGPSPETLTVEQMGRRLKQAMSAIE